MTHDPALSNLHADLRQAPEYLVHEMMEQVRYQLRRRMEEMPGGPWTQARLAEEMGVKPPVVNRLLRAAENTSLLTLARAARALGLGFAAFKLVPKDEADAQVDEFGAFVRGQRGWWPCTRRPSQPFSMNVDSRAPGIPTFGYTRRVDAARPLIPANDYAAPLAQSDMTEPA